MLGLINWRLKVTLNDGRTLTGQMLAFDKHMNLVLVDCEEFRRVKSKKKGEEAVEQELKRTLGLIILRGETVVSISVEGPPPVGEDDKSKSTVSCERLWCEIDSERVACSSLLVLDEECPLVVE